MMLVYSQCLCRPISDIYTGLYTLITTLVTVCGLWDSVGRKYIINQAIHIGDVFYFLLYQDKCMYFLC